MIDRFQQQVSFFSFFAEFVVVVFLLVIFILLVFFVVAFLLISERDECGYQVEIVEEEEEEV